LAGESAGCEAFRAERLVDEIRRALLPGAKRPATTTSLQDCVEQGGTQFLVKRFVILHAYDW
jgi:hypothetical protein